MIMLNCWDIGLEKYSCFQQHIFLRSELTYDKVTVVAGGNDCDDGVDVETVIEDMTTLIITAK